MKNSALSSENATFLPLLIRPILYVGVAISDARLLQIISKAKDSSTCYHLSATSMEIY